MAYGDFKNLNRTTSAEKVLRDEDFDIDQNAKYDGYQNELAAMVCNCFNKKVLVVVIKTIIFQIKN